GPCSSGTTFSPRDPATARFARRFLATRQRPSASRTALRRWFIWRAVSPRYSASTVRLARENSSCRVSTLSIFSARLLSCPYFLSGCPSGGDRAPRDERIDAHGRPHRGGECDALHVLALGSRGLGTQQAGDQGLRILDQLLGTEASLADRHVHDARLVDAELDLA